MADWAVHVDSPETVRAPDEALALHRAAKQTVFSVIEIVEPPPPPPDPVPRGEFYHGDDMTLPNDEAIARIWGQHSEEGPSAGSSPRPGNRFEWMPADDGPLVNGVRTRYRRLVKGAQNRRNEIGQVNKDTGFVFPVDSEFVIRAPLRQPGNIAWVGSGDNAGAVMQAKHSGAVGHGGFGGDPFSPGPPLGIEASGPNNANRMTVTADMLDAEESVWVLQTPHMVWIDLALHVRFAFDGFINVYYAPEGEPVKLVKEWHGGTIKQNKQGRPMFSTLRFGCYDQTGLDRLVDLGPVNVDRLD